LKFHLADMAGMNLFTGYDHDYVAVNHRHYQASLIVLPERLIEAWPPRDLAGLEAGHLEVLLEIAPEIMLLGTGDRLCFPHPRLTQALTGAGIGLEVMDTPAACRTFNILASEGRKVAAALLITPA
jgi:uncharacterized protein